MRARPEYRALNNALRRCSPRATPHDLPRYYARGIRVAAEWHGREGFARFFAHIGPRPSAAHSLDRIDNDRGYEPGNVRWATRSEQQRNMRTNVVAMIDGARVLLADVAERNGIPRGTFRFRVFSGWEPLDAATAPLGSRRARKAA